MEKLYILLLCLGLPASLSHATPTKAVCVVPIADLVGEERHTAYNHQLPIAHKKFEGPARVHQLLYNEIVEIHERAGNAARIKVPQLFYETAISAEPHYFYWTLAKNLQPLNELTKKGISEHTFPRPLTCNKNDFENALRKTVSLAKPFFDTKTRKTYSAGTRFVIESMDNHKVAVSAFDDQTHTLRTMYLPKNICLLHDTMNHEERLRNFVNVVKRWAHLESGFIPYVWGGCSVGALCTNEQFAQENGIFTRTELTPRTILAGVDCAGLIARAAHVAGIPYFYKNSLTAAKHLATLRTKEKINEGDILWIPGHVMVVSSIKEGTLVEARHYSHGYGKVHEIKLSQQFKNIGTYEQLATHFFKKQPLQRLDKAGNVVQVIPEFKILKLASVWRN